MNDEAKEGKKFVFDVGWVFFSSLVAMALGFILRIFIGRVGTDELGIYTILMTLLGFSRLIGGLGVKSSVVKYGAERKDNNQLFSSTLTLMFLLSIISTVVLYILTPLIEVFFHTDLGFFILFLIISLPFVFLYDALLGILNSVRKMNIFALGIVFQSLIFVFISIYSIVNDGGLYHIMLAHLISFVISTLILGIVYIFSFGFKIDFSNIRGDWKKLISFGGKIFVSNVINLFNYQIDIVLVGFFLTASDVGIYSVAYTIVRLFWIVPQSIQTIVYPATSDLWTRTKLKTIDIMCNKSMSYTSLILSFGALISFFFGNEIIVMIFGAPYSESYIPLLILLFGTVTYGTAKSIGGCLAGVGKPGIAMNISLVSAIINVSLNLILIPQIGISGAAYATSASFIIFSILVIYYTSKHLHIKVPFTYFGRLVGIISISIILYYLLSDYIDVIFSGIISMAVFMILSKLLLITNKEIREIMDKIFPSN